MRKLGVLFAFMFMLVVVPTASAEITSVFDGKIPCTTQGDGQRLCEGGSGDADLNTVDSWDGTPIDVNVGFPDAEEFGEGPYPMAMYFHGFGGGKEGFGGDLQRFLNRGIAVFSMTERGFRDSCGNAEALQELEDAGRDCEDGFIHLMDSRYEVRDAQYMMGLLADEDLIKPKKIGTVGASYGGGKSMALAALKNRIMLPDGTYAPWKSPEGKDLEIAAAAPIVPWTDFAYSLLPNGRTLDYVKDSPYQKPFGIMKIGIISALLPSGDNFSGENGPVQPEFDILGWKSQMEVGEPYGGTPTAELMFDEMTKHHSSYYIDDSVEPAPLLIAQGFSDDLFPIDEPLRYYNRSIAKHPNSTIQLLFADIGHPRAPLTGDNAQGRALDKEMGFQRVDAWFSHYLLDDGTPKPPNQVEVKTQVCPYTEPSAGPYTGSTWPAMSPGEVRLSDPTVRVIEADSGLQAAASGYTMLSDGCTTIPANIEPGTADFDFGQVPAGGLTLMGAPTVVANVSVANGAESQVAARLVDVDTDGRQRLISRGLYRPDVSGPQIIQLHGNAYKFEEGHRIRLQLLPKDGLKNFPISYARPSNNQMDVTISDVDIRLPVREAPGAAGGMVKAPLPKVLPAGAELAGSYSGIGSITTDQWSHRNDPVIVPDVVGAVSLVGNPTVKGKQLTVKVKCQIGNDSCSKASLSFKGSPKKGKKGRGLTIAKKSGITATPGQTKTIKINLTKAARKFFKDKKVRKRGKKKTVRGAKSLRVKALIDGKAKGFVTVKRVGRVK